MTKRKNLLFGIVLLIAPALVCCGTSNIGVTALDLREQKPPDVPVRISQVALDEPISSVAFVGSQVGWALQDGNVVHTDDGGKTWKLQLAASVEGTDFKNIHLKNEFTSIDALTTATAISVRGDTTYRTSDGGRSWIQLELKDVVIRDLHFADETHGWLAGEKRPPDTPYWKACLFRTTDGGKSWGEMALHNDAFAEVGTLWSVSPQRQSLWLVGDKVFRSADGGHNWTETAICEAAGTPSKMSFFDDANGWLRTNQGTTFCTTSDGGRSWRSVAFPEELVGVNGIVQVRTNSFYAFGKTGVFFKDGPAGEWAKVADGEFLSGQYLPKEQNVIFAGDSVISIWLSPLGN